MGTEEQVEETVDDDVESENSEVDEDVRAVERDLANDEYRRTDSECHEDGCEGTLWYDSHTLVCSTCWTMVDLEQQRDRRRSDSGTQWEQYQTDRPTYDNSGRVQLPGGFISAYDWMTSEDTDDPIVSMNPAEFYL